MPTKLTFDVMAFRYEQTFDWLAQAGVKVVKVDGVDSEMNIQRLKASGVELVVFRPVYGDGDRDPQQLSVALALSVIDRIRSKPGWPPKVAWEGLNEPDIDSKDKADALNQWFCDFAKALHARGELACGPSFAQGNPTLQNLPLLARMRDAFRELDFCTVHEYNACFGYHREIYKALPVKRPMIITECGHDRHGDPADGWRNHLAPAAFVQMMTRYAESLDADPYVAAACLYQLGDGGVWGSFDVGPAMKDLVAYIQSRGGGHPPFWTPPPDSPLLPSPPPGTAKPTRPWMDQAVALVKQFEGFAATPYQDAGGRFAIGYGHTYAPPETYTRLTEAQAEEILREDLLRNAVTVERLVRVPLSNAQWAALMSFVLNVGTGALSRSELLVKLNAGDLKGAANELWRWVHAGEKELPGLVKRRQAERQLFLDGLGAKEESQMSGAKEYPDAMHAPELWVERYSGANEYWKLVGVEVVGDVDENGKRQDPGCHIYVQTEKADGAPAYGVTVRQFWPVQAEREEGHADQPTVQVQWPGGVPYAETNFFMGEGGSFDPQREGFGPYGIRVLPESDLVKGMGLPLRRHRKYVLRFRQRRQASVSTPIIEFDVSPAAVRVGESVTLSWHIEGVKAAYLDGEGITGPTGTRVMMPKETTTYRLSVVQRDGATQVLTRTVTVRPNEDVSRAVALLEQALALLKGP